MKLQEITLSDLLALKQILIEQFNAHLTVGNPFEADIISDVKLPKVLEEIKERLNNIIY